MSSINNYTVTLSGTNGSVNISFSNGNINITLTNNETSNNKYITLTHNQAKTFTDTVKLVTLLLKLLQQLDTQKDDIPNLNYKSIQLSLYFLIPKLEEISTKLGAQPEPLE